ncbi:phosphorylated adapter RNA export protein-like isoform X2 [Artemia franciscana]|uniref:Phosphorylated adapter RNA export protein n=2 Tax=Artemia franciscana TaxID=6661 RepID=A0AA88HFD0_ARTSF|nr:hypothetical protein QYM36_016798 [Artemia franciscana]
MDNELEVEEGELSDASEEENIEYVPLDRPQLQPRRTLDTPKLQEKPKYEVKKPTIKFDSESDSPTSGDSDEDGPAPLKRRMISAPLYSQHPTVAKVPKQRNDIWSNAILEQTFEEEVKSFNISRKANEVKRDVESFFYDVTNENGEKIEIEDWKEDVAEVKTETVKEDFDQLLTKEKERRGVKRGHRKPKKKIQSKNDGARYLQPLVTTAENKNEEVAKDIQTKLFENNYDLIENIVNTLGKEAAIRLYNETRDVEEMGGLKTVDNYRRRTSGGVFFFLVRKDDNFPMNLVTEIFKPHNKKMASLKKRMKMKKFKEELEKKNFLISPSEEEGKTRADAIIEAMNKDAGKEGKSRTDVILEAMNKDAHISWEKGKVRADAVMGAVDTESGEVSRIESAKNQKDATPSVENVPKPNPSPVDMVDDYFDDCVTLETFEIF